MPLKQVSYGTSAGPGLAFPANPFAAIISGQDDSNSTQPVLVANTLPAQVPIINTPAVPVGSTNTEVTGTAGVPPATPVSAPASLSGYLASVISHPSQHLIAVSILLLLGWWFYKHVLKKI